MDEQQQKKYVQMTQTPVSRLIPRLALPCIISMLVTAFYNMADTYFRGADAGTQCRHRRGGRGAFPVMAIIQAIGFFFGHGQRQFLCPAPIGQKNYRGGFATWPPRASFLRPGRAGVLMTVRWA